MGDSSVCGVIYPAEQILKSLISYKRWSFGFKKNKSFEFGLINEDGCKNIPFIKSVENKNGSKDWLNVSTFTPLHIGKSCAIEQCFLLFLITVVLCLYFIDFTIIHGCPSCCCSKQNFLEIYPREICSAKRYPAHSFPFKGRNAFFLQKLCFRDIFCVFHPSAIPMFCRITTVLLYLQLKNRFGIKEIAVHIIG